ncbi:MAG: EpsG family protein [Bacteroidales bacterium]|nr:EpsG family protein [Bacteroidales bacterium]
MSIYTFSTANWVRFIFIATVVCALFVILKNERALVKGSRTQIIGYTIAILAIFYIGLRPTNLMETGDSVLYAKIFNLVQSGEWRSFTGKFTEAAPMGLTSEGIWTEIEWFFVHHFTASNWFLFIAFIYIGALIYALRRWLPNNMTIALIFVMSALMFWGYAVNGLRQGMAASICIMGLATLPDTFKKNYTRLAIAVVICYMGCACHSSMLLFMGAMILSYLVPSRKNVFFVWMLCLFLSPFSTSLMVSIGSSLIDDNRLAIYAQKAVDRFSHSGWRWDFIIYSALPVLLGWYLLVKRRIGDATYLLMLNIYIYTNSFWLLLNSVAYSNRFAYISWCLYPFLIAYPLLKFKISVKQPQLTAGALILFLGLTLVLT